MGSTPRIGRISATVTALPARTSTKFGRRSLSPILPLERIQTIVTDDGAPAAVVDALRDAGVDVHVVPVA